MNPAKSNLTKILSPRYAHKWVALTPTQTKVVASSESPQKVLEVAHKKGINSPVVTFVLRDYRSLVS